MKINNIVTENEFKGKYKKFCLYQEVRISIKLLLLGFKALQGINEENNFYHLPFLLLSSGFERLMKCMVCFKYYKDNNKYPNLKQIQTHDLIFLKDKLIKECIPEAIANKREATKDDYKFIKNNKELNTLIKILSKFGQYARYYNLDVVVGISKPENVEGHWKRYELELISKNEKVKALYLKNKPIYNFVNKEIIIILERFARALVRQFTLGDLGNEVRKCVSLISPFLFFKDEELGKRNYSRNYYI